MKNRSSVTADASGRIALKRGSSTASRRRLRGGCVSVLALVFLGIICFPSLAADFSVEFDAANRLYEQGKFSEAAAGYEKIAESGSVSPALYFNLGNAYFKANHIGKALVAYRQAEKFSPRDPDIRANLQFARNQVQNPTMTPGRLHRWLGRLTLNEWTMLAAIAFWVCLLSLAAGQIRPVLKRSLRTLVMASALAAAALSATVALAFTARPTAIVVGPEANVRSGPLAEAKQMFVAHDGAELEVLDHKDDWLQVTAGQRVGWVKKEQVMVQGF